MTRALLVASSLSGSNLMADAGLEGTETERQVLSKNRLTEESPQVDLRSSNQKHWLFGSYGLALAGPTGDLVCDRQAGPSRTAPQAR